MRPAAAALVPQMREALRAQMAVTIADAIQSLLDDGLEGAGRAPTEASGGVRLDTIGAIAATGVTYVSVGRLTQSAPAVDIGLDFAPL